MSVKPIHLVWDVHGRRIAADTPRNPYLDKLQALNCKPIKLCCNGNCAALSLAHAWLPEYDVWACLGPSIGEIDL